VIDHADHADQAGGGGGNDGATAAAGATPAAKYTVRDLWSKAEGPGPPAAATRPRRSPQQHPLYGLLVLARRALNGQQRRSPARAEVLERPGDSAGGFSYSAAVPPMGGSRIFRVTAA
jgi:hypothetical protein